MSTIAASSRAEAQITVLLREDDATSIGTETGIDEGLRDSLGGSVRRLEPSLEDLALAAGCEAEPNDPSCIALVAAAAGASLVAIERGSHGANGWRIQLDLRRGSDGAHIRSLSLQCASASECQGAVVLALDEAGAEPTPPVLTATSTPVAERPLAQRDAPSREGVAARAAPDGAAPPHRVAEEPSSVPVASTALFVSSVVVSIGAIIAGGIAIQASSDASTAGILHRREEADRVVELESTRDLSLGVGTGLAIAGACLAAGGLAALLLDRHEEGASLRVAVGIDGDAGLVALGGTF